MSIKTTLKPSQDDSWLTNDGQSVSYPGEIAEQFSARVGMTVPIEAMEYRLAVGNMEVLGY